VFSIHLSSASFAIHQGNNPQLMNFFILITCLLETIFELQGENRPLIKALTALLLE